MIKEERAYSIEIGKLPPILQGAVDSAWEEVERREARLHYSIEKRVFAKINKDSARNLQVEKLLSQMELDAYVDALVAYHRLKPETYLHQELK